MRIDNAQLIGGSVFPRTLLAETEVTSPVASVDFDGLLKGFDRYLLIVQNMETDTNNVLNWVRFGTEGTYHEDTNYWWQGISHSTNLTDSQGDEAGTPDAQIVFQGSINTTFQSGTGSNESMSFEIMIHDTGGPADYPIMSYYRTGIGQTSVFTSIVGTGGRKVFEGIDSIQMLPASGNIDSGVFKLYGLRA